MTAPFPVPSTSAAAVRSAVDAWRAGAAEPDAAGFLRDHPDVLADRSLVVDLAYEEYCLREEAGETPDAGAFCDRLPAFRSLVREVIRGHRAFADYPDQIPDAPAWPAAGDEVEHVRIDRELGRGAFARVYLGTDEEIGGRRVVLKVAPARSREARTLGPLDHPHVVTVHWARRTDDRLAVCMPYVGAATLREAVEAAAAAAAPDRTRAFLAATASDPIPAGGPAPVLTGGESYPDAAAKVLRPVADALTYLHGEGLAHGDLKASNVLLAPGGHAYLIDFQLATATDAPIVAVGGTLPYMAPERLRLLLGNRTEPQPATAGDVYAFGVVLHEALTGRVPYPPIDSPATAAVAADLLARAEKGLVPNDGLPHGLAALVVRCLAVDPAERPTMAGVRAGLDRYLGRRVRRRFVTTAAVAVFVAAVTGYAVWGGPPRDPADVAFEAGLRELAAGNPEQANSHFILAYKHRPDGLTAGYIGYCSSLSGDNVRASFHFGEAMEKYGFAPDWLRNDHAFTLVRQKKRSPQVEVAFADVRRANPDARPVRLNLLNLRLRDAQKPPLTIGTNEGAVVREVRAVMAAPPYTAEVYFLAAKLMVLYGDMRPGSDDRNQAMVYLEGAVRMGRSVDGLDEDLVLKHLAKHPNFANLKQIRVDGDRDRPNAPFLMAPPPK